MEATGEPIKSKALAQLVNQAVLTAPLDGEKIKEIGQSYPTLSNISNLKTLKTNREILGMVVQKAGQKDSAFQKEQNSLILIINVAYATIHK